MGGDTPPLHPHIYGIRPKSIVQSKLIAYNNSMPQKAHRYVLAIAIMVASLAIVGDTKAQAGGRYFPETGHTVRGDFLEFYESNPEAELVYGYPITDAFVDAVTGRFVQYFQRARFELHSDGPPELRVRPSPLGRYLYVAGPPLPVPKNFPACKKFPDTDKEVCYAFLDFFEAHGGVEQFGYPISNFELHDARIVQYFQRARFEWHPERTPGNRVVLTDLGSRYFRVHSESPKRLIGYNAPQIILNLQALAFTKDAVTALQGEQTIYVVVRDQNKQPVSNASVTLTVTLPSGEKQVLDDKFFTDGQGKTEITFYYTSASQGLVLVDVEVAFNSFRASTGTSFRLW